MERRNSRPCSNIEHEATINRIVTQLYDAIIKGRTYGAIIGELHDKGYEARIQELEDANKNKDEEIRKLQSENTELAQSLYQLKTSEPPIKKDFKAMG